MVRAIAAFLDFCYLVRRSELTEDNLNQVEEALGRFHHYRSIFQDTGVRSPGPEGLSLPRQHAASHYRELIESFGAPNGLCSSITEAKHIKAVKEPWRRSSRYKALGQMLVNNQRQDKLAASRVDFVARGMLQGACLADTINTVSPAVFEDDEQNYDGCSGTGGLDLDMEAGHDTAIPELIPTDEHSDERSDGAVVGGRTIVNTVTLAKTP